MRRAVAVLVLTGAMLLVPNVALAHPLGNFTVNTSAAITLSPSAVRIDYVVDMAEIPTVQALSSLDRDENGTVSDTEGSAWAADRADELLGGFVLTVDGVPVSLVSAGSSVALRAGQAGLDVVRLEAAFTGSVEADGELVFRDANLEDRLGWHEVTAVGVRGVEIRHSTAPATSPSNGLREYPSNLLSSPVDVRTATVTFAPGVGASSGPTPAAGGGSETSPSVASGRLEDLVARTGPMMVLAIALAFGFGALHALGPGHGKTLMAASLVAGAGRVRQAFVVGCSVAVMHTASVLALGLAVLVATEVFTPERVYPWLGLVSGVVTVAVGLALLSFRVVGRRRQGRGRDHAHAVGDDGHPHEDGTHVHPHPLPNARILSGKGLAAIAVAGGIAPSPTALVVLLGSVALGRAGYGLALIGAFSLGLAAALVAVGLLAIRARDLFERRLPHRIERVMPVACAGGMVAFGCALSVRALSGL